jgi:hypothetical protein
VRAGAEEEVESLYAIVSDDDLVRDAVLLERSEGQQFIIGVVLDEENQRAVGHVLSPCDSSRVK